MDDSSSMSVDDVGEVLEAAFEKWAAAAKNKFTFEEVTRDMQADIKIRFQPRWGLVSHTSLPAGPVLDNLGVTITFGDKANWIDVNRSHGWCNFRFAALHEIGHALGLGESHHPRSVMSRDHRRFFQIGDPDLHDDDIQGIEELCDPPSNTTERFPSNFFPPCATNYQPIL